MSLISLSFFLCQAFCARRYSELCSAPLALFCSVLLIINLAPCPHFFIVFCSWRSVFALCSLPTFCSILHQHYYAAAVFVRCCFLFYAAPYFLISAVFCSLSQLCSVFFFTRLLLFQYSPGFVLLLILYLYTDAYV